MTNTPHLTNFNIHRVVIGTFLFIAVVSIGSITRLDYFKFSLIATAILLFIPIFYIQNKFTTSRFIWAIAIVTLTLTWSTGENSSVELDNQAIIKGVLTLIIGAYALLRLFLNYGSFIQIIRSYHFLWLLLYLFLGLVSVVYSTDTIVTLFSVYQILAFLGMAIVIEFNDNLSIIDVTLVGFFAIQVIVWGFLVIFPEKVIWTYGALGLFRLGGTLIHSNELGPVAAYSGIIVLARLIYNRNKSFKFSLYSALYILASATVFATQSRTSILTLILGSAIVIFLILPKYRIGLILIAMLLTMLYFIFPAFSELNKTISNQFSRGEDITRLAGRVELWDYILYRVTSSTSTLWFGYSYPSDRMLLPYEFGLANAHNLFLSALFNLGLLGLAAIILSVASITTALIRSVMISSYFRPSLKLVELFGIISGFFLQSFSTTTIGSNLNVHWYIYLAILATYIHLKRKVDSSHYNLYQQ